jgi:hypothetical protein
MRSDVAWRAGEATFTFTLDPDDPGRRGHASMPGGTMRVRLPLELSPDEIHPDLEALAAIVVTSPFTGPDLVVARAVSTRLEEAVARSFKVRITPVDKDLPPRDQPVDGPPGLAFSGGADSAATLAVLPLETVSGFTRRIPPLAVAAPLLYRDDAAMHACETLREQGRQIHVIETDMEHLRTPLGFPTDWANAIGLILMADHLRLRGIAWGVVAESAYRVGHEKFIDWADRRAGWTRAFAAAGLHFDAPVAGVSEVGTTTIVSRSPLSSVVQSCIRGGVGAPCRNCWKCFRKSLLDAAISDHWPDDQELDRLFQVREVDQKLSKLPIPHENVIGWIAGRYPGAHPKMRLLRQRALPSGATFSWLEHWYGPSADLLDPVHRDLVAAQLDSHLGRMSAAEETSFRTWDMTDWLADPTTTTVAERLVGHRVPETAEERAAREAEARQAAREKAAQARRAERQPARENEAAPRSKADAGGAARAAAARPTKRPRWLRAIRRAVRRVRRPAEPS